MEGATTASSWATIQGLVPRAAAARAHHLHECELDQSHRFRFRRSRALVRVWNPLLVVHGLPGHILRGTRIERRRGRPDIYPSIHRRRGRGLHRMSALRASTPRLLTLLHSTCSSLRASTRKFVPTTHHGRPLRRPDCPWQTGADLCLSPQSFGWAGPAIRRSASGPQ